MCTTLWRGYAASPKNQIRCAGSEKNPEARNRMKSLQLGINYGMGVPSLARGLNRHPLIASGIIERHRREYPRYWEWRDDQALSAKLHRGTESIFGWPLRITTSPNVRTLYNFPMQSGGAEMLRLAAWRLHRAGLKTCMLIHDGVLLELNSNEELEHAKEIMVGAGYDVCPGLRIDAEPDQLLTNGARYRDKRPVAKAMWKTMMSALQADWGSTGGRIAVSCIVRNGRRIAIDTINTATPARKKRKPFEVSFVKLPKFWIDQLRHARKLSTVTLAHVILT